MCILGAAYGLIRDSAALEILLPFFRIGIGILLTHIALSLCRKNLSSPGSVLLFAAALIGILWVQADSIWFLAGAAVLAVVQYFGRNRA